MRLLRIELVSGEDSSIADHKVHNVDLGLMAHSCRHPCHLCGWVNGDECDHYPLRTYEGIREENAKWVAAGSDPNKLKHFMNCRSTPLSMFPEVGYVWKDNPPSSLHLKLGLVNQCHSGMMGVYPGGSQWAIGLNIEKSEYHGAVFEGGECNKLLDNTDKLEQLMKDDPVTPRASRNSPSTQVVHPAQPFLNLFRAIKRVRDGCFGYELQSTWEEDIAHFKSCFQQTGKQ